MPFPKRLLTEGEEIVLDLRPHWIALAGPVLATILIVAGAVVAHVLRDRLTEGGGATFTLVVAALALVLWIPLAGWPILQWRFTQFVLTNERIITRSGVIAKRSKEIPIETINDVTFNQTILERVINAGDLVIESAGETGQNRFTDVRRPEEVQLEIYRRSERRKGLDRAPTVADELAKLADLRDRGVLTEAEFQERKRRLLEG